MMKSTIPLVILLAIVGNAMAQTMQPSTTQTDTKASPVFFNPIGGERPKGAKTEISAADEATFDNEKNIAEFSGRVVVKDPQFTLTCDKLTVHLNKDRKGIESAVATGNAVVVQENGKPNNPKAVGRAGEITYKPETGEVVMRKWPSIQQGINNQVATEESTIMILKNSGQSRTMGGSKTVISETSPTP